ncbi:MAG TPA: galactokinase family protein, partial [Bacteroidota bacterium]|nr:galactokinase family protein [Bacteroidota bacterium]
MELAQDTIERFRSAFGMTPEVLVSAPARVNLIGEHTDYNDGYVLPVAIDRRIFMAATWRADRVLHLRSTDLRSEKKISLDSAAFDDHDLWTNYPVGAGMMLETLGVRLGGANLLIRGNIPIGAGLSSSAACCVASVLTFARLAKKKLEPLEIIKIAQRTETEFVGVQCGIMDQFVA